MVKRMKDEKIVPSCHDVTSQVSESQKAIAEEAIMNTQRHIGIGKDRPADWNIVEGENNFDFDNIQINNA